MKQTQPVIIASGIPGPIVTIIWGTHGNEICGIRAIDSLQGTLKLKRGKVFLMYGNIEAIERGVRQIDLNLNRMFRWEETFIQSEKDTVEYKRSREIIPYLDLSDASLDLHSSPSLGSPAFIICEENCSDVVKEFPFPIRCYGFAKMEPGGTDGYMNSRGKIGICIECGNHNDREAWEKAVKSVQKFLEFFDMIDTMEVDTWTTQQQIFTAKYAYLTRTNKFRVVKIFADFENITKWQMIWYDEDESIYAQNTGKILFARDRNEEGVEGFVEIIIE
jgi:succinylglutamate desuccinylase